MPVRVIDYSYVLHIIYGGVLIDYAAGQWLP